MAARAISSATISFGLVSIPVKIYSTSQSDTGIHFNMLHGACGTRLKQRYVCPNSACAVDGEPPVVETADRVKGYEFTKGQFVTFSDAELKAFDVEANRMVEINEFVPLSQVDPIYYENTYYLGPGAGGERPYRLLRAAMRETGQAAVARYAARGKQYTVLVRPFEEGLLMQQLRYVDEIKDFEEVPLGEAEIKPIEIQLAVQLIEQIRSDAFEPDKYEDEVKARIHAAIDAKVSGQEVVEAAPAAPTAQIVDLMEALKASLAQAGGAADRKPARRAAGGESDESSTQEVGAKK